jgi:sigma-E factor negative regulatory protein RseB
VITQLSHWRMASAAAVFVLAGSSAVALAMHNESSGGYQAGPAAPAHRRSPGVAHTAAERAGRALLSQAATACASTAFSGVQLFRFWGPAGSRTWLAEIWHRPGGQIVAEPVSDGDAQAGAAAPGPSVSLAPSGQQLALLQADYVLDYAGQGRAGGRPAELVTVDRPDGRLAAKYWLDAATRLPLRRQLFDRRARMVSDISLASLRTGPTALTGMPAAAGQPWSRQLSPAGLASLRAQGWPLPGALPAGMALVTATTRAATTGAATTGAATTGAATTGAATTGAATTGAATGQVIAVSYSDGLSVISLFVQRGQLPARIPGWKRVAIAGHAAYAVDPDDQTIAWSGAGYVFTLLADAPATTVDQAIGALPQGNEPAFWGRLGRGFRRLVSWANPFR